MQTVVLKLYTLRKKKMHWTANNNQKCAQSREKRNWNLYTHTEEWRRQSVGARNHDRRPESNLLYACIPCYTSEPPIQTAIGYRCKRKPLCSRTKTSQNCDQKFANFNRIEHKQGGAQNRHKPFSLKIRQACMLIMPHSTCYQMAHASDTCDDTAICALGGLRGLASSIANDSCFLFFERREWSVWFDRASSHRKTPNEQQTPLLWIQRENKNSKASLLCLVATVQLSRYMYEGRMPWWSLINQEGNLLYIHPRRMDVKTCLILSKCPAAM